MKFKSRILDNVHGFIYYTEPEERIMKTALFKRLQSIRQLSIVNWEFPGAEHTRYIHSLGVMHIADKIAVQLELDEKDRKILRLAGLLHDIGHYPLSHTGENTYKDKREDQTFYQKVNQHVIDEIQKMSSAKPNIHYMSASSGRHHEKIGSYLVKNNKEIREIIFEAFPDEDGEQVLNEIAGIITGDVDNGANPLLVQILHSELDADGIDYMMRDALFSGTSFGAFEVDQLIGCMRIGKDNAGHKFLCITPKGIAAADQYLINKFFSYAQVTFNKHVVVSEWMIEQVMIWMQRTKQVQMTKPEFPSRAQLKASVFAEMPVTDYVRFTDDLFWTSLQWIADAGITENLDPMPPEEILKISRKLLAHEDLEYVKGSEVKIISKDIPEIIGRLTASQTYKDAVNYVNGEESDKIALLAVRKLSRQIPEDLFRAECKAEGVDPFAKIDKSPSLHARMLMECITVLDDEESESACPHLLCEDERSLIRTLYDQKIAILRQYSLP